MKNEIEITVLVKTDYETLKNELSENGFILKEVYELNDDYLINSDIDIYNMNNLDILKKCILVRDIINIKKVLLYKNKKYSENGDIIEQAKVECPIYDIQKAIDFMEAINYRKLFHIYNKCIVFINNQTELVVELVNNKYIFIEMESNPEYVNRQYKDVKELIADINKYDFSIDKSNYFVKKTEILLKETINKI